MRISKGAGDYPWGFRIQFSKPIVVTEVDTSERRRPRRRLGQRPPHPPSFCLPDGAAEEAGLMVGDYVLAVNGTDVTGVPHSEAADLARRGR